MKRKIMAIIITFVAIIALMYAEYRYIMVNIHPYRGNENTIYLEIFDQVDEYYVEE